MNIDETKKLLMELPIGCRIEGNIWGEDAQHELSIDWKTEDFIKFALDHTRLELRVKELEDNQPDESLKAAYNEIIMAVASKYPNESRHQTALRYIREREDGRNELATDQLNNFPMITDDRNAEEPK